MGTSLRKMVCAAIGLIFLQAAVAHPVPKHIGYYSADAVPIWGARAAPHKGLTVPSPDGLSRVRFIFRDSGVIVQTSGAIGKLRFAIDGVNAEVLWSPDSQRFFVTFSDGGLVGDYNLYIVEKTQGRPQKIDLTPRIKRTFGNPVRCAEVGERNFQDGPNVGGIAWLGGSDRLLVAAEIPPHSVCDSFGTFRAYEFDLTSMRVTNTYDQLEAKARFGDLLGEELRAAPDECIQSPKRCYVSSNHSKRKPR